MNALNIRLPSLRSGSTPGQGRAVGVVLGLVLGGWLPGTLLKAETTGETTRPVAIQERNFWAFRPPERQTPPEVANTRWPRRTMDRFILSGLEERRQAPALEASRRVLLRRITYDLTGLPPSPEELDQFLADSRPDAYERRVEQLLKSPRYGERLASLWLPLARYAEDQAHQVGDDTKFFYPNAWLYRAWVIEAFNRDLPYDRFLALQLAADRLEGPTSSNLAALGFLGLGPKYYNRERLEVQADEWEDRVDTTSRAMLGLTVACARCHDHKFDPISMADYYALAGVFANTRMVNRRLDGTAEKGDAQTTNLTATTLHVVEDASDPKDLPVFLRGSVERKGPMAPRQFLPILSAGEPRRFHEGSGRKELAEAVIDPKNPTVARVMVNRMWSQYFGRPLVPTLSNFGHSGQPPSRPRLLDDLAVRFIEQGWSLKWLTREMVLSAAYRQGSAPRTEAALADDAENEALSPMNRRRLTVEQWRDTLLFVSGELDLAATRGPSPELEDAGNRRRTVYARISRLKLNDLLMQFDYPDANVHAEKRSSTTTAMQKLFVLNSPFMQARSQALVARLRAADPGRDSDPARIRRAYVRLFCREPAPEELQLALEFLRRPASGPASRWEEYAQMLLASNELLYVD